MPGSNFTLRIKYNIIKIWRLLRLKIIIIKKFIHCQKVVLDKYEKQIIGKFTAKFNWLKNKYYSYEYDKNVNKDWIENLPSKDIPQDILYFLWLGEKCYINPSNKYKIINEKTHYLKKKFILITEVNRNEFRSKISVFYKVFYTIVTIFLVIL